MPDVIGTLFHKEIPYGGVKGDKGDTGATPNISATASVDSSTGTPSVNVVKTGTAENPSFEFAFSNLKGEKGEKGDPGSGSSVSWGEIDGDIADQTDLSTELGKKYDENDTAETDIDDADYFPFYDTSATAKKKSLWSNIKDKLSAVFALLSIVGTVENGTTASKAYAAGEHFVKDGYFCTAIAAIAQEATLTLNTNYKRESIAGALDGKGVHFEEKTINLNGNSATNQLRFTNLGTLICYDFKYSNDLYYLFVADNCDLLLVEEGSYSVTILKKGTANNRNIIVRRYYYTD